ncbi:MAG: CoA pyrophosphatase [Clostridiales bacterium]|nr:CoA pyrophosphatase [Clostridiales bacterium]
MNDFSFGLDSLEKTFEALRVRLQGPKPGLKAQLKMVTSPRRGDKTYLDVGDSCLKAGVLVLLYPRKEKLYLVLTRRTSAVAHHQAQISFPGGRMDKGESAVEAAIREAHEELQIMPDSIRILGELTPLYVPPSNYCIYPVVAAVVERPDFRPSPIEVSEIIEVPVEHLLDSINVRQETWPLRGIDVSVPFYFFKGHKIWGATAMILAELVDLISSITEL